MIGRTLGNHRILEKLGEGGMGEVYLAEDASLKRKVALKVLPEEVASDAKRLTRFRREAEAVAALNHPNIVTIHTIEEADGVRFLTMEHVEGRDLAGAIPPGGMPLERFFDIAIPLADALAAAHDKGIAHRDLKPANVMLTEEGRVKILDFGLAKRVGGPMGEEDETLAATAAMTVQGQIVGTLAYMSPEQAQGKLVDARSDIFSLGVVLYEMATSERPFLGDNSVSVLSAILKDQPPAPSSVRAELPVELNRILQRCLEKEPADRFQTARDVCNEIKWLRSQVREGTAATRMGAAPEPERGAVGKRTWIAVAAVAALLGAGIGWRFLSPPDPVTSPEMVETLVALPAEIHGSEEQAYLTDALPSALTTHLAGFQGLETKVPPRSTEVEKLGGSRRKLAKLYDVSAFVETTVTKLGADRLALDVRLVQARGRGVLWSEHFSGTRDGYQEMVRQAADGLRSAIRPGVAADLPTPDLAASSDAELALERGKYATNQFDNLGRREDFERAEASLKQALELDPSLVEAAAQLAQLYGFEFLSNWDTAALEKVDDWTQRTMEIDPRSSEAWAARTWLEILKTMGMPGVEGAYDPVVTLDYALRAAALGPRAYLAQEGIGLALAAGGYSATLAMASFAESARLNPFHLSAPLNQAAALVVMGETEESRALAEKALTVERDHLDATAHLLLVAATEGQGSAIRRGLKLVDAAEREGGGPAPEIAWFKSILQMGLAFAEGDGDASARQAEDYFNNNELSAFPSPIAWMLARWNQPELALRFLEREAAQRRYPLDILLLSPDWEGLRDDARFVRALEEATGRFQTMLQVLDDARARDEMPAYLEEPLANLLERLGPAAPMVRAELRHSPTRVVNG